MAEVRSGERVGSSQSVIHAGIPGLVFITDQGTSSILDRGPIPGFESAALAAARVVQTVCFFKYLEQCGVPTHFVRAAKFNTFVAHECRILDKPLLAEEVEDTPVHCNLELLFRVRASEKFCGRVERGEVPRSKLKLPPGEELRPGVKFEMPFVESSTKWQEGGDVYLTDEQAAEVAGLQMNELVELYELVSRAGLLISDLLEAVGFVNDDGKFEAARRSRSKKFLLVDRVSFDELGPRRNGSHYGKNLLRNFCKERHPGWVAELKQIQKELPSDPSFWPPYPLFPKELLELHVAHYEIGALLLQQHLGITV